MSFIYYLALSFRFAKKLINFLKLRNLVCTFGIISYLIHIWFYSNNYCQKFWEHKALEHFSNLFLLHIHLVYGNIIKASYLYLRNKNSNIHFDVYLKHLKSNIEYLHNVTIYSSLTFCRVYVSKPRKLFHNHNLEPTLPFSLFFYVLLTKRG